MPQDALKEDIPADELAELERISAVAHGPAATEAQRRAVAIWDTLLAKEYQPRPTIRVPATDVGRAKFPVIDVHKHLGYSVRRGWPAEVEQLVEGMDRLNIRAFVNLDGLSGPHLRRVLDRYAAHAGRFLTFTGPSWHRGGEPDFGEREARDLEAAVSAGARGYKIFKALGLWLRDPKGELYLPDDPRLDPIWETAGRLKVPVLIHVADPEGFFLPADRHNDRLSGVGRRAEWYFGTDEFPSFERLMESQVNLFKKHPRTAFFGAHVLNRPDHLEWVGKLIEECPNVYPEISARINDLGRQPRFARAFFERHQDRVLFGTDGSDLSLHPLYFRVLETEDDLILGPRGGTPLYGLGLPDATLRRLYHDNAARLLGIGGT
ncbi:MAG TPA: amidohydrolase family protein [Chloroflexota bacterium]|nr:amidohydrolase family protein [Chloroflexota bacterium]